MQTKTVKPLSLALVLTLIPISTAYSEDGKAKKVTGTVRAIGLTYILGDRDELAPSGIGHVVAYVDDSGEHGLEAKTNDESDTSVPPIRFKMTWADAIIAAEAYNPEGALGSCVSNCWHLPTKAELQLLYEQKTVVGGFANHLYWSSTELGSNYAWLQYFTNGNQYHLAKYDACAVRAVRTF